MWNTLVPEKASTFADQVDPLFWALTLFVGLCFIGVLAVWIYFGVRYRKQEGEDRKSIHTENMALEIKVSIILMIIAMGIFAWGTKLYFVYATAPENTLDINVIGKRWMWKIQHPNGKREVNELHVPLGQPVKLTMTSQDVIHSFYVPAFRVKQDVLPARYTTLWFEANKIGIYKLFCAEYCGTQHSTMGGTVYVMKPAEYEEWLGGGAALTPLEAGAALFSRMGCAACHDAGNLSRGPKLQGIFGSEVTLRGGDKITVDEEYLRESILNPTAKIVNGYAPLMPTFAAQLKDDDVLNLIAYLKSLSGTAE